MQAAFQSIKVWACVCVTRNSCCTKQCYLNTFESRLSWRGQRFQNKIFHCVDQLIWCSSGIVKGPIVRLALYLLVVCQAFFFLPTRHARTQGLTGQRKQGDSHNKAAQREICQQLKGVCATSKHYLPMFQSKASTLSDTHTSKHTHTPKPPHTIDQEHSCVHKRLTGSACFSFSTAQPVSLEQFSLCVEVRRL